MLNSKTPYEVSVQFRDDDQIDRMFFDMPLKTIPSQGDRLNVKKDGSTYFLLIEDVTHIMDYERDDDPLHAITITAKCEKIRVEHT